VLVLLPIGNSVGDFVIMKQRKKESDKMHLDVLQKIPAAMKVLKQ